MTADLIAVHATAQDVFDDVPPRWGPTTGSGPPRAASGRFDPEVLAVAQEATREISRRPGFFAPEVTPPADADDLTRYAAHLGRTSMQEQGR